MKRPTPMLFSLQQLVSDLSLIDRNHHILGSERSENDVEHSFTVGLLCWYIHEHLELKLDLTKMLKYAMVHDFAERYAGDVNTFASEEERVKKVEREAVSLSRLVEEFSSFNGLVQAMQNYEEKVDEEAEFVWTVDKMQSLILGDLDNWRPYKKVNVSFESFCKKHGEQIDTGSKYCKEIFEALLEYCKTTYYDRPSPGN